MLFLDRLKEYMKNNALKQKDIITDTGLSSAYISMVLHGERNPNKELLNRLQEMSGKSVTWWINGADEYDNLYSLNLLIERLIEENIICMNKPIPQKYLDMLHNMLLIEIDVKLENKSERAQP